MFFTKALAVYQLRSFSSNNNLAHFAVITAAITSIVFNLQEEQNDKLRDILKQRDFEDVLQGLTSPLDISHRLGVIE